MAYDVFISYASTNLRIAEVVCATLESKNIKCWIAPRNVLPGVEYAESIITAIENSYVMVLILSSSSCSSPHVLREVNKAASDSIPILSFIIEEVNLSKSLEYYLSTDHWLNAMTPPLSIHIQNLAETVEKLLNEVKRKKQGTLKSETVFTIKKIQEFSTQVREETKESILLPLSSDKQAVPLADLKVDISGSEDFRSIQEAVDVARDGQIIIVKPGIYRERIEIENRELKLYGDGYQKVKISSSNDSALVVNGEKKCHIKGFSFAVSGAGVDTPVCLIEGSVNIENCRFSNGGKGIQIAKGEPELTGNICDHNHVGISVEDLAGPLLNNNQCHNNQFGILYSNESGGRASENICRKNRTGIRVIEYAEPELAYNECSENKEYGIEFCGDVKGIVQKNICKKNQAGLRVNDNGKPLLEENNCSENLEAGISYAGKKGGIAHDNECIRNKSYGIQIGKKAEPLLKQNKCNRNRGMGIAFFESAGGTAKNNICNKNDVHGILVREQAQPFLEGNKCNDNREAGIAYFDNAAGYATQNVCRGNKVMDISVSGQATPKIK